MAAPRLLFCIGAAKSGTSWLYSYLDGHPDCHLRGVKELHYFDGLDLGSMAWQRRDNAARLARAEAKLASEAKHLQRQVTDRAEWLTIQSLGHADDQAYLDYLSKGRTSEALVADITPAYALLSEERFRQMATLGDTRFLYILRDPLARLWSHVRMNATRKSDGAPSLEDATRLLRRTINGREDNIANRSDYGGTLARLTAAVPAAQRLVITFEDLLTGGIPTLCAFLGIAPHLANAERVIHPGTPLDFPGELRAKTLAWLAPHYEAAIAQFGKLPQGWENSDGNAK
ncbi:MAG: sulfotransferase [Deltaproteobacteria bacterium]